MTLHTDFDDDYPEGIDAGVAFDPSETGPINIEPLLIVGAFIMVAFVGYHWILPYLRSAATAALLLASAQP